MQHRARRLASGRGVEVGEAHALGSQRVHRGGRDLAAVAAQVAEAGVVQQHEDDVRPQALVVSGRGQRAREQRHAERDPGQQPMQAVHRARASVSAASSIMSSWPPTMPRRPNSIRIVLADTPYFFSARLANSRKELYTPA